MRVELKRQLKRRDWCCIHKLLLLRVQDLCPSFMREAVREEWSCALSFWTARGFGRCSLRHHSVFDRFYKVSSSSMAMTMKISIFAVAAVYAVDWYIGCADIVCIEHMLCVGVEGRDPHVEPMELLYNVVWRLLFGWCLKNNFPSMQVCHFQVWKTTWLKALWRLTAQR